ncbi:MAG: PstA family ABC transporter permease, partial [Bilophila wadsworthia]
MTTITFHSDNTSRQRREAMMFGLLRVAAGINILALVGVCVFLLWNGSPAMLSSDRAPRRMMTAGAFGPASWDVPGFRGHADSFPARRGLSRVSARIRRKRTVYPLSAARHQQPRGRAFRGVQAVGLAFFVTFLGMGVSLLAGVLTLAVLTLPVIINTTEEALRQVPDAWREASLALGATRSQTIARVVLPAAVPGMLTGAILGLARAAGETAAIMFTAAVFYTPKMPDSVFSAVMSLPYHMY